MRVLEIGLRGIAPVGQTRRPDGDQAGRRVRIVYQGGDSSAARARRDGWPKGAKLRAVPPAASETRKRPLVNGQPTDLLLTIDVFNGERPGQAKGAYEIAKKSAGDVKPITGVGDEAYWDDVLRVFRVVKGNVGVDVTIASDLGGLKTARAIAEKVVAKLP